VLAAALQLNRLLVVVYLSNNSMTADEGLQIVRSLEGKGSLVELYLDGNPSLFDYSDVPCPSSSHPSSSGTPGAPRIEDFAASIRSMHRLQVLNLSSTGLERAQFRVLVEEAIEGHGALIRMAVKGNPCTKAPNPELEGSAIAPRDALRLQSQSNLYQRYFEETLRCNQAALDKKHLVDTQVRFKIDVGAAGISFLVYFIDVLSSLYFYTQQIQGEEFKRYAPETYQHLQPVSLGLLILNVVLMLFSTVRLNLAKAAARNFSVGGVRGLRQVKAMARQSEVKQFETYFGEHLESQYAIVRVCVEDLTDIAQVLVVAHATGGAKQLREPVFLFNFILSLVGTTVFVVAHLRTRAVKKQREVGTKDADMKAKNDAETANFYGAAALATAEEDDDFSANLDRTFAYLLGAHCMWRTLQLELELLPKYLSALVSFRDDAGVFDGHVERLPWAGEMERRRVIVEKLRRDSKYDRGYLDKLLGKGGTKRYDERIVRKLMLRDMRCDTLCDTPRDRGDEAHGEAILCKHEVEAFFSGAYVGWTIEQLQEHTRYVGGPEIISALHETMDDEESKGESPSRGNVKVAI
jgi:hypothetical protein